MAPKPGVLVISHGSREEGWVSLVDEAVEAARAILPAGIPVETAFLELVQGRLIQDGIDKLEQAGVTYLLAIPLFISSGSTHVNEIGWALGAFPEAGKETELEPVRTKAVITYGQPIDDDPEIADVLTERALSLSDHPGRESVLLIGHGSAQPGFHEAWRTGLSALAVQVRERGGFAEAEIAMLRPDLAANAVGMLRERNPEGAVVAVPVFLSEGYFTKAVIPSRLEGLDCRYEGMPLMPHPKVAEWIGRQAGQWLRQHS